MTMMMTAMMTNDFEDFLGAVWKIVYYTVEKSSMPEEERQKFLDSQTREMNNFFQPPPGLSPADYAVLFMSHFQKSRNEATDMVEKMSERKTRKIELFQVGNAECLAEIEKIKSSQDFYGWENPEMVHYYVQVSKKYL